MCTNIYITIILTQNTKSQKIVKNVLCKNERHQMSEVHSRRRGSSARVEVKGLALLVGCQNGVEVSVREKDSSAQKGVCLVSGHFLEAFDDGCVDFRAAESLCESNNQLI